MLRGTRGATIATWPPAVKGTAGSVATAALQLIARSVRPTAEETVPHLAFYASGDDVGAIVEFVLHEAKCVVYESYSVPDRPIRTFVKSSEALAAFDDGTRGLSLMLHAEAMKGAVVIERVELKPDAIPGKSWRERVSGWGLIQIEFGQFRHGKLLPSHTNHNTAARARTWEATYPTLPPVEAWDFREVTRASRRINRYIAGSAIRKEGARAVLPGAQKLVDAGTVLLGAA